MRLSREDGALFYRLYPALMAYTNRKFKVVHELASDLDGYLLAPGGLKLRVRDVLYAHKEAIDGFVRENPAGLPPEELDIVTSWKNAVVGDFYVLRYLKHCTVFLHDMSPPKAYDVVDIDVPLVGLLGAHLPVLTKAVLLPFKDKIICDGLLLPFGADLGEGTLRSVQENYRQAKAKFGVISSLPLTASGTPVCPSVVPPPKGKYAGAHFAEGVKKAEGGRRKDEG